MAEFWAKEIAEKVHALLAKGNVPRIINIVVKEKLDADLRRGSGEGNIPSAVPQGSDKSK